jgi:prophage antirepressor-like protein
MSNLINFNFGSMPIRALKINTNDWFVAADVCAALEIKNVTMAMRGLDEDEQALSSIEGLSKGNENANIVNESGLWSLVLKSRKVEAKRFKKFLTGEVIPSLRKTGTFSLTINDEQQRAIQEAVNAYVIKHRSSHNTVYSALKTKFKVAKYDRLPCSRFDECLHWLEATTPALAAPTTDTARTLYAAFITAIAVKTNNSTAFMAEFMPNSSTNFTDFSSMLKPIQDAVDVAFAERIKPTTPLLPAPMNHSIKALCLEWAEDISQRNQPIQQFLPVWNAVTKRMACNAGLSLMG